jgi:hypothetical protein
VVVFAPLAPALLAWPLLPADRVTPVLEIFRDWALRIIIAGAAPAATSRSSRRPRSSA